MKKYLILIFTVIFFTSFIGFAQQESMEYIFKYLIVKRTEIWNKIYHESYGLQKFKKEISEIERGSLLQEDVELFRELKDNPSDMALVKPFSIKIKNIAKAGSGYEASINIEWEIEDIDNVYRESCSYVAKIVNIKGKWYMESLDLNQKE